MPRLRKGRIAEALTHTLSTGSESLEDNYPSSSRIGEGAEIQGDLEFSGDMFLAGKFEGSIKAAEGNLELSHSGVVQGNIHCQVINCFGQVYGDIRAENKGFLRSDCKLIGDIVTKDLSIQNGAQVSGHCKMLEGHTNIDFFAVPIDKLRKQIQSELKGKK